MLYVLAMSVYRLLLRYYIANNAQNRSFVDEPKHIIMSCMIY